MSIHVHGGTMTGGVTPVCDRCGVSLCWDISRTEYLEAKAFWDSWICQDCNGSRLSAYGWRHENGLEALPATVQSLIEVFEATNPDIASKNDERRICDAFVAELGAAGFGARVEEIASVEGESHIAVILGAFTIDWTADRYDEDAPTPLVFRTSLGWPIEPAPRDDLAEALAALTPQQLASLKARLDARRNAA